MGVGCGGVPEWLGDVAVTVRGVNGFLQAEKTKQESRSKDEAARRLEERLQAAEAKLKAKEQMCQALSDKVGGVTFVLWSRGSGGR